MKKLIILFLIILVSSCATTKKTGSRSTQSVYTGTGVNTGTGESLYSFATKFNNFVTEWKRIGGDGITADSAEINVLDGLDHNVLSILDVPEIPIIYSAAADTSAHPVPGKIGNMFIDTSAGKVYISVTALRNGWRILN